jgi:hypothetical protein
MPHIARARLVGTFRHPLAFAQSAAAFNKRAFQLSSADESPSGLAYWLVANHRLLAIRERIRFPLVEFGGDFGVYRQNVRAAFEALELRWDEAAANEFLDAELVHEQSTGDVPEPYRQAYERLVELAAEDVPRRSGWRRTMGS